MKKKLFSIMAIAAIAMTSCKKEEVLDSNQLGEATINGNIYADLDQTNDVNAAGLYVSKSNPENVEGITVTVTINTGDWDQSPDASYAYPEKTYTATTDVNGDYTLVIPCTDEVTYPTVSFGTIYTTQSLYTTDGTELTDDIKVGGNSASLTIYSGANINVSHEASISAANGTATYEYGSAKVRIYFQTNSKP